MNNCLAIAAELPTAELPLADWARATKQSPLQEMLSVAARPDILSFALGVPAPEMFPAEAFAQVAAQLLQADPRVLQYSPPPKALKAQVVSLMRQRGVACSEAQVFLTAGAQQGLSLLARLFLNPGGQVLIEELTYTGLQQVLEPFRPEVLVVPTCRETGIDLDAVEALLRRGARPAFIYTVSEGHNPLGISLSEEKRGRLVGLAQRYGVPLIEDDAYGFLSYDGEPAAAAMRALDDEHVFYVGSFSKILSPALRVGWIVAPARLAHHLSVIKESSDINTATFSQHLVSAYLETGRLPLHLAALRREYGARRDALDEALHANFSGRASWSRPRSGVFIWVELLARQDSTRLLRSAIEKQGISFVPGSAFRAGEGSDTSRCLRLNFSSQPPARIRDGIERLSTLL